MFAMYDDDGLNFRSSIDHLYDIHKVAYAQSVNNNPNRNKNKQNNESFKDKLFQGKITEEAKNKYKQMTNIDTGTEIFHVEQIMSHSATIISDDKTIDECYSIMQENKIQQLLIRSDTQNHLKGMVSKHDILNFLMENIDNSEKLLKTKIYEISRKNIITTEPISDIRRVSKVMIDFDLNAIPVVDSDDIILGMVTRHDMIKAVSSIPHLQVWA